MKNKKDFPNFLAKPAQRALANFGIQNLKQLSNYTESEIANLHGIGKNALDKIVLKLAENGLKFMDE